MLSLYHCHFGLETCISRFRTLWNCRTFWALLLHFTCNQFGGLFYVWLLVHLVDSTFDYPAITADQFGFVENVIFLHIHFRELIECFSVAYQSKVLTVSLDWLKDILFCESALQLVWDLKYYGLESDPKTKTIKFQRDSFQASKPIVIYSLNIRYSKLVSFDLLNIFCFHSTHQMKSRKEHFVNSQLEVPIEEILLFKNVA